MKVMVTGGAGFIGSHVVDAFVAAGHDVLVVDDLSIGKREQVNPAARLYVADIRDAAALEPIFASEKPEAISHQAARANVRESMEKPVLYADVNVLGSLNLLEAARRYGVRKVIYASTGGAAYGEPVYVPVDEQHPVNPLDPYGASKHHVEHYLFLYRRNYGLDYTVLRYPNVYGPRQDPLGEAGVIAIFTGLMLKGGQPIINGDGEQLRDHLYVGDVARANVLALDKGSGEIINLGTGVGTSVNQVFAALKQATGYTGDEVHGPPKLGEVSRIYLDASKARAILGWQPEVALDEGLKRTVAFFRA
ncbi:MAG: NAD-dependent epimerase/dehydratase family protein [Anaerolineae bacterium]